MSNKKTFGRALNGVGLQRRTTSSRDSGNGGRPPSSRGDESSQDNEKALKDNQGPSQDGTHSNKDVEKQSAPPTKRRRVERFQFEEDYRGRLPKIISRFTGWRSPQAVPPYEPLPFPPFTWLHHIPLKVEVWIFAWIGSFVGILLIETIMSTNTVFRDVWHAPLIITSYGASAVLQFGVIESPLAQPRNAVLGQFFSALVGVCITRLFDISSTYEQAASVNDAFQGRVFVNGALTMSTSLLVQLVGGIVHPPAGATALNAAVEKTIISMSWTYLPAVLASSLILTGWACIFNNLGRRRYPIYWWSPESHLVRTNKNRMRDDEEEALKTLREDELRKAEDGGRTEEGLLEERLDGEGGSNEEIEAAYDPRRGPKENETGEGMKNGEREESDDDEEVAVMEPEYKQMSEGDRRLAEGLD